ncbi:MAG: hypothetical protein J7L21_07575 [Sulfurimonas sp.]|nr:hypothetical protein [Sulfurimonas sp.]
MMIKILKRLELIKIAISIEDEEIIELQIVKLETLDVDEDIVEILQLLKGSDYVTGLSKIESYVQRHIGIVVYEDKEISALKLELKALESKLQTISEEKIEYLNDINEFNVQYNLHLGGLIQKVLKLKEEIFQNRIKIKQEAFENLKSEYSDRKEEVDALEEELAGIDAFDDEYDELYEKLQNLKEQLNEKRKETKQAKEELEEDEVFQKYEEVREDYEEFSKEYEETISQVKFKLNDEEQKELKKLFRKASRLCHPDIVADELKQQAHEVMAELNQAYREKNLERVKKILASLESGMVFEVASDKINDKELLRVKITDMRDKIEDINAEIDSIKEDETYETLTEIDDLEDYFRAIKDSLQTQLNNLQEEYDVLLTDKLHENSQKDDYWKEIF